VVTHVVLFRLRDRSAEHVQACREKLEAMPAQIPEIRHLEVGANVKPSERHYDLCLVTRFDSLDALAVYADHPAHVPVAAYLRDACEHVAVVDYES
jgi:antibiotic biosynthesis monooxygenase (ABM) superfamily enzyme